MIRILLADDHKVFREGLESLIRHEKDLVVVGQAKNEDEIMAIVENKEVDVILLDITMAGTSGIDVTRKIKAQKPEIKILAFSMHDEKEYVIQMLKAGAAGYLLKNTGKDEMLIAIHAVAAGDSFFSHEISEILLRQITNYTKAVSKKDGVPLTVREIEVLGLITNGLSNLEIAEKLFISIRTVDTHRRNLLKKLNVKNTAGLVRYAIKHSIIE